MSVACFGLRSSRSISSVTGLLRELVAIPSLNPAFCQDRALSGESRVASFLAELGRRKGLAVSYQPVEGRRKNLLLTYRPTERPSHRLLLAPHMDTVVADAQQLTPLLKNGRLYGRGACDTKGSIASMFDALVDLIASPDRPKQTEIQLACLVDEEHGQMGSRAFAARSKTFDLGIVGEPTSNRVVSSHKGVMWFELRTQGKAAHGSRPGLGHNAVADMAKAVLYLEEDYRKELTLRPHPVLGPGSINVGTIAGGKQPNIVPDACSLWADRRLLPGESYATIARHLLKELKARGVRVQIHYRRDAECPALETDLQLPWVKSLMRQQRQRKALGVDYFCDAAVIASAGTPCVVMGPGSIDQAHTVDEWISLASLEAGRQSLRQFMSQLP